MLSFSNFLRHGRHLFQTHSRIARRPRHRPRCRHPNHRRGEAHATVFTSIRIDGSVVLASKDEVPEAVIVPVLVQRLWLPECELPPKTRPDVAAIVKAVTPLHLDLAIAGGKHSSVCYPDNAVVIDLTYLNAVTVNKDERWIDVGGGAKIGAADLALIGSVLCFVIGTNPDTGVGGSTQAGGWGWLARQHGLAVDH
ncbi:Aste57867_19223 [Aphanomyces stellatus]|uniref:Aste57867_15740 protein n=1 Tax=Aphanomyces stellatus TaxID=120398 RepID=A0A485L441_9STRA|nr:hypothetical protein As57867_019159 [Aphanomyces stellatus]KAF0693263.1 hypothetical protein As57867_015684 [Aphanomyces stellatus]VFT92529.1 Aste57867_15740 [Aphanomyces stellatus]VFT95944.1 Aste57867_19223 [Aphanomyces stellatus]